MKMLKAAAAAMIGTAALAYAGTACATTAVYDLNVYDSSAGFNGKLGTVTVDGQGTNTLSFDVSLNSNVFFQMQGNGAANDVFWFDLNKTLAGGGLAAFTGTVTTSISTPNAPGGAPGGDYPTGGQLNVLRDLGNFGHGWSSGYNYGATDSDSSGGGNLDYYTGHFIFTLSADDGSLLSLDTATHNGVTIYGGADLRQCPGTDSKNGGCNTGPIGFSAQLNPTPQSAVPEPATWAMMLAGFGLMGGVMRRRKPHLSVRFA